MESYPGPSGFSSLQQLLEALATIITEASHHRKNAWVLNTELDTIFRKKHAISIERALHAQVSGSDLRNLLCHCRSPHFRVYPTSDPQKFYIRLLEAVMPHGGFESQVRPCGKSPEHQPTLVPEMISIEALELALIEIIKGLTSLEGFTSIEAVSRKFCADYKQPIQLVMRCVCSGWQLIELLQTMPTLDIQKVEGNWQIRLMTDLNG
ncbi:hypothetical protein [Halomicronema sp. CCY15110]|uniref:hypothetical protein n=1 Tax=Halomicronema sp. CCY15110 TaxID=2767773 RepID=UPI00194F01D1|nr:hypothetical protein [Halomicronema sp. CCY15110]